MVGRELQDPAGAHGQGAHDRPIGTGGVQHPQRVLDLGGVVIRLRPQGAIRAPVARPVVDHHPVVARQVRNLHLPGLLVDDGPRGQ